MSKTLTDILIVTDIRKSYEIDASLLSKVGLRGKKEFRALDGVSLGVGRREILGLVGESGSGKTTLARCLVRLVDPDAGQASFDGQDILAAKPEALRNIRRRMQLIYQDPYSSLNPRMRVGDAISEAAMVHGFAVTSADRKRVAIDLLEAVGLSAADACKRPREMSGGQRQRVAIARALAVEPQFLIADEAVSALDVSIQAQILNLFARLAAERELAMIFITHQLAVVAQLAQRVAIMYMGRIVEIGATADVYPRPGHPYTAMLLQAHPSADVIGRQPGKSALPVATADAMGEGGCRFRNRCPMAQAICSTIDPPATDLGNGHQAYCHFATDVAATMPVAQYS